jgi:hypothetical protein
MSQCPGCGAFCFIDMDGHAVIQNDEPQAEPQIEAEAGSASTNFPLSNENIIDVDSPENPVSAEPSADWQNVGSFDSNDSFGQPEQSQLSAVPNNDDFESIDLSPSENKEPEPESEPARETSPPEPSFGPADDPLNLNEFANSEVSSAKDGPLLFRVLISGIDTREIRESIREVIEDPRFAWDSNEIFSKISKGHLAINGLSPVKASILITRIKRLPVEIRWEQYAIAQGST